MATGVPNKNGNCNGGTLELAYLGKSSRQEILSEPAQSTFETVLSSPSMKRLYCGDNLDALKSLLGDATIRGKVELVYIDPPFATRGTFLSRKQNCAYDDDLFGAEYVESLRKRLFLIKELLSASGSIYLHLDENMIFHAKLIMDEVFGLSNYRNMIVRKKCNPKNYTRKTYGNTADFILFYTKTDQYTWNRPVEPLSEQSMKEYHYVEADSGRRYMKVPLHAPGKRNGATGETWRGKLPPPGKHWQYTPKTLDAMDARGEIFWSKNGNPRRKVYLDEHPGVGIQDIWLEFRDAHNQNIHITGYPTEKNPELLRRIIQASSNPGDLVLDCYAGSGTTLTVADDLQRNWIGIDRSTEAISTILNRCATGLMPMGDYAEKSIPSALPINQPSLFDAFDLNPPALNKKNCSRHTPITDFSIYIEVGAPIDTSSIVHQWVQQHAAPPVEHVLAVSENSNTHYSCHATARSKAHLMKQKQKCNRHSLDTTAIKI